MTINTYYEFEFTANDLDSGDTLTDIISLRDITEEDKAFEVLQKYIDNRHPITTLTGNSWEIESISFTGLSYQKDSSTKQKTILTERDIEYSENSYPLMNSY